MPFPIALLSAMIGLAPQNATPPPVPAGQAALIPPAPTPQSPPTASATPFTPASPTPDFTAGSVDYPDAYWVPASPRNFQPANRPMDGPIDMVIIHDIEGTAESAVRWFANPRARAASHYVVDGTHGVVYQVVREHDIAWHCGNHDVNGRSVGIEHEGFAYRPGFYNPLEYEVSAKLVRSITTRYRIPRDRTHIIGHSEVPNPGHPGLFGGSGGHTDPGPWWDWDSYMILVRNDAALVSPPTFPATLHPGETAAANLVFTNVGDDPWPAPAKRGTAMGNPSETTSAIGQRAKGLIYLGAWSPQNAPFSPASAFYGMGWTSPRYVGPIADDTEPSASTAFNLTLHAPRTLGPINEQFRLIKLSIAPHVPVAFGPTISVSLQVVPWDMEADSKSAGPISTPAQWQQTLPIGGAWDVYARWPAVPNASDHAAYQIMTPGSTTPQSVVVDQSSGAGQWRLLGRYRFDAKQPAQVTLLSSDPAGKTVGADAIRFVGPFPGAEDAFKPLTPLIGTPGPRP